MFFVLSKTLDIFAQPLVIVIVIFVAAALIRKPGWKKILFRTGFGLLLFFSNDFIAQEAIRLWEIHVTPLDQIKKKYDYAILLTGVTKTMMMPKDRVYFGRGADRATHTLQLYKLGIVNKVIVSGGSGRLTERTFKEADELAGFLRMAGIAEEDIIVEHDSDNTHESAVEVKKILEKNPGSGNYLLVTAGYHMKRSAACYKKAGILVDTFAVDPYAAPRRFNPDRLLVPKLEAITVWQILLKEWMGMTAYWVAGYV